MILSDAIALIKGATIENKKVQSWLDLGCGTGLFTEALASLLPTGSHVIGVDSKAQDFTKIKTDGVTCSFLQSDMTDLDALPYEAEGIMMANALHFVEDQQKYINQLNKRFGKPQFIIVEYDNDRANNWVPYPINKKTLKQIFPPQEFSIDFIGERDSRYQGKMYAAFITSKNSNGDE